jgi:hypothetical protein
MSFLHAPRKGGNRGGMRARPQFRTRLAPESEETEKSGSS